jgi:predicted amidohydrolase
MNIKVTVCELHDEPDIFISDWDALVSHVLHEDSQLVVLPEMPFSPWFGETKEFDRTTWQQVVETHNRWIERLAELAPAKVLSSRPIERDEHRLNEGFLWETGHGYRPLHRKYYLPDEAGVWEASWYERGDGTFTPYESDKVKIGFLICTELWAMEEARIYGKEGVHLLINPRMTQKSTLAKWQAAGQVAAILSGAFCLSSNRNSRGEDDADFGGRGWIIDPNGDILALTSREQPFATVEIDLEQVARAKQTYPRYVFA